MADSKVEDLTDAGTLTDDDYLYIVNDPTGTPAPRRLNGDDLASYVLGTRSNASVLNATTASFLTADETKLDGIETSADVTDETNVTDSLDNATLTDLGTPASGDLILLQDASDTNTLKVAQFSEFGGGGSSGPLDVVSYNPGTTATKAASGTLAALDTTNLRTSFTVPTSGNVLVRCTAMASVDAGASPRLIWGLLDGASQVGDDHWVVYGPSGIVTNAEIRVTATFYITGLTGGASETWDFAHYESGSGNGITKYGGLRGPAVIEVWAA